MKWSAVVGFGLCFFVLAACDEGSASEEGARAYETHCASCHGVSGQGDGPAGPALGASDLTGPEVAALTDAEIRDRVRNGGQKMPPMPAMSDEQLTEVVLHVRGLDTVQ